jgi:hypothetical protein
MALRGQLNRTFVVGLAGETIASFGLFILSNAGAGSEMRGSPNSKATSECVAGR